MGFDKIIALATALNHYYRFFKFFYTIYKSSKKRNKNVEK